MIEAIKTMKKIKLLLFAYLLFDVFVGGYCGGLFPLTPAAAAQTILTNTTFSAAVGSSDTVVRVGSTTGFLAGQWGIYSDSELMPIAVVINSTTLQIVRQNQGFAHASGALVFAGPLSAFQKYTPTGSCTRANILYLPWVNTYTGVISDCNNGQWINGDSLQTQRAVGPIIWPPIGNVLYTGVETNGTAAGATTEMYCEEIDLPYSKLLTGLALLNGTTATTDNHNVELYDAGGKLLGNSAAAGAIASGASAWQKYNFTSTFYAVGPALYYGCFTANGTTATVRHTITSVNDVFSAFKITGLVFGTISASITPPGTFTTALGPYLQLY